MKKTLVIILGLGLTASAFAQTYTMYEESNNDSKEIAKINDHDSNYKAIFAKKGWVEIVDKSTGQVGWVEQSSEDQSPEKQGSVDEMFAGFEAHQQQMQQHFNKVMKNFDRQFNKMRASGLASGSGANTKVTQKSSSIMINSDGKTAKVVKTINNNGNVETIEKEIPAGQLNSLKIEN